jgi:hypothetical protein
MIVFLWFIDSITMFFAHLFLQPYFCLLTVNDVFGSVFDRDDGFVSFACSTACLSFLLIFPFAIPHPPCENVADSFPENNKKILNENPSLYKQYDSGYNRHA